MAPNRYGLWTLLGSLLLSPCQADGFRLHRFEKLELATDFTCEGAGFGDIDGDGQLDAVAGPYWFAGPDFAERHRIYPERAFDRQGYSDNFFSFVHDLDADGDADVLVVGFPGTDARWFENTGEGGDWPRHEVFSPVDNESPTFADLTGDGRPELICQSGGRLGWAAPADDPRQPWSFHPISEAGQGGAFSHGLGVGDIDGDGRLDVLSRRGWWQQPDDLGGDPLWLHQAVRFGGRGGAQMFACDVDGDGDSDVITSEDAHGWGISWYEQELLASGRSFTRHEIIGERPRQPGQICFGNPHALALADMDGDGLPDIVSGNRFWAHGGRDKADHEDPLLVWFRLVRGPDGVRFEAREIDDASGVGTQVSVADVDRDGLPEVLVGNKRGIFLHKHRLEEVSRAAWFAEQRARTQRIAARNLRSFPVERTGVLPRGLDGRVLNLDFETGDLQDWEDDGEAFEDGPIRGDTVVRRRPGMRSEHQGEYWLGGYEEGMGDAPRGSLISAPFVVTHPLASFLIGGGSSERTRVELLRVGEKEPFYQASGADRENLAPRFVDLSARLGDTLRIRVVDDHSGGWGHVNFDDFRFHDEDAELRRRAGQAQQGQLRGYLPEEAAQRMQLPEGFRAELVAGEPELQQPIAFCFDARGRLWVAEAWSYPVRRPEAEGQDRIVVFEDRDADGSFETRSTFAEGLNLVSGLEVGFGGVWVGAAPYLLFIPDADGDLVPDAAPEVLLDGWGYQDTHETLNSFIWGPDGWLYGCHGVFTHSRVGPPGAPEDARVPLNAGVWRFHPQRRQFEVFAHGTSNPWGIDFDDRGQAFITACVIPHLYHVVQGGRYRRQSGRHFNPYTWTQLDTIADHLHYLGARPHDGNGVSASVGGGHAHCGAMVYLGDAFPPEYRGLIFMNNVHGKRVLSDIPAREGSGFRAAHGPDLLLANDNWFLGINLRYGPDGNVFLIDWYDRRACHDRRPEAWDRTNGRLYKLSYGAERSVAADLTRLSDLELVDLQSHANDWFVRTARRLLQERGGSPEVRARLWELCQQQAESPRRLRALWALHACAGLSEEQALALLTDPDADLRAWTVQLWLEAGPATPRLQQRLLELARTDSSPVVRLYLAAALPRLPRAQAWSLGEALLAWQDADDPNIPALLWYGLEPLLVDDPARALQLAWQAAMPQLRGFILRRLAGEGGAALELLVEELGELTDLDRQLQLARAMQKALAGRGAVEAPRAWDAVGGRLLDGAAAPLRDLLAGLAGVFGDPRAAAYLRGLLGDPSLGVERRRAALRSLQEVGDVGLASVLLELLDEAPLRLDAIRGLAAYEQTEISERLLLLLPACDPAETDAALETLACRPASARALLAAVESGAQPRSLLDSAMLRRQLAALQDAEVDARIARIWGRSVALSQDTARRLAYFSELLAPRALAEADLHQGRFLASRACLPCHTLFGEGGRVGPDLTGSNRGELEYLLRNILDPNLEVGKQYLLTRVQTRDGRLASGVVVAEDSWSITLDNGSQRQTFPRASLRSDAQGRALIERSQASLMPEGLLEAFDDAQVRDLVAYLQSPEQVPMAVQPGMEGGFFNGVDLEGWHADPELFSVEDGVLVGRSPGLAANVFAWRDLWLADFRLLVEVQLVGDRGNSGIQIRSTPEPGGGMRGYQADIGPGWWGRLYEEEGRGLLAEPSQPVRLLEGWNRYEILARGGRIQTAINGRLCVDLTDPTGDRRGVVGLQLHAGQAMEVRFRNFELELDPEPGLRTLE